MPVYNERATVETAVQQVLEAEYPVERFEVVLVDDGSIDGTREPLADHVVARAGPRSTSTRGTSARALPCAPRSGTPRHLRHGHGRRPRVRPGEHRSAAGAPAGRRRPRRLRAGRFASHSAYSFWYVVGNKTVTLTTNLLYNSWLSDIMTCHKLMEPTCSAPCRCESGASPSSPRSPPACSWPACESTRCRSPTARSREEGKKLTTLDGLRVLRRSCAAACAEPPR